MSLKNKVMVFIYGFLLITACNPFEDKNTLNNIPKKNILSSPISSNNNLGATADIKELATIQGKIYNEKGELINFAIVKAKSLDKNVPWVSFPYETLEGQYIIRNVPVGINIEITVSKNSLTKSRVVLTNSNLTGNPNENKFDFGHSLQDKNKENNYFFNVDASSSNSDPRPVELLKPSYAPTGSPVWDGSFPPTNSPLPYSPTPTCPPVPTPTPIFVSNMPPTPYPTPCS